MFMTAVGEQAAKQCVGRVTSTVTVRQRVEGTSRSLQLMTLTPWPAGGGTGPDLLGRVRC